MAFISPEGRARPAPSAGIRVVRNAGALSAEVDGELVALDPENGVCFGLNRVASRIWTLLESPVSVDQICAVLTDEYAVAPERCASEVEALIGALIGEGLAAPCDADTATGR